MSSRSAARKMTRTAPKPHKASAKAVLTSDGKLTVSSATGDIGTGTYTIMTQIAAERLGLPLESVSFKLGDSSLPNAPVEGGSFTAASVGSAVYAACEKIRQKLLGIAKTMQHSPLAGARLDELTFADGQIRLRSDASGAYALERLRSGDSRHARRWSLKAASFRT